MAVLASLTILTGCATDLPPGASSASREEVHVLAEELLRYAPIDASRPVYEPTFVSADAAELQPTDIVVGYAFNGEAKAYPEKIVTRRGMVNDTVGGIPILVSW